MTGQAGKLRKRIEFQVRGDVDDGYGNVISGPFETKFETSASFKFLRGGETVMAARLTGKQTSIITVRQSVDLRSIDTSWRIKSGDVLWNIRTIADPDDRGAWFEILAESGVGS